MEPDPENLRRNRLMGSRKKVKTWVEGGLNSLVTG